MKNSLQILIHLHCFLIGRLVGSSSLPSSSWTISSAVGNQVVLPCSWRTRLGVQRLPQCHVQWVNPADTVFEQRGGERFEAEQFRGRVEVPEDQLGSGDCSLIITDVQLGDTGSYESFMVVDGEQSRRTRVFIQSVVLSVHDHKSFQTGPPGGEVVLELHTQSSVRVVFQGRNSSEWSVLWVKGQGNSPRLEKHPLLEQLTLKKLKSSDEGTYKVLDEQGLSVSTVQLSLEGPTEKKLPVVSLAQVQDRVPTDVADQSSSSALLLLFPALIVTCFL